MNTLAALILAVVTALSAGSVPEPEHDPATRAQDMAEAPTGAPESDGSAAHAQTHTEEPTSPHEAFLTPLAPEYVAYCVDVCEGYGLDPAVVFGVMQQESQFTPGAVGDGGKALGIMQVQPRWHGERMARLGVTDLTDEWQAVLVGCDYLAELLTQYGGDYRKALTAYRYGDLNVTAEDYAGIVMENANNIRR